MQPGLHKAYQKWGFMQPGTEEEGFMWPTNCNVFCYIYTEKSIIYTGLYNPDYIKVIYIYATRTT